MARRVRPKRSRSSSAMTDRIVDSCRTDNDFILCMPDFRSGERTARMILRSSDMRVRRSGLPENKLPIATQHGGTPAQDVHEGIEGSSRCAREQPFRYIVHKVVIVEHRHTTGTEHSPRQNGVLQDIADAV